MPWVYILKSDLNDRFYVGSTKNLQKRFAQHLNKHTQTTARMGKIILVFSQEFTTLKEAQAIEKRLKKLKRKDYLQKIIDDGFIKLKIE